MIHSRYTTVRDDLPGSAADLLDGAAERGRSGLRGMQERALRAFDDTRDRLSSTGEQLRRGARDAALATDDYVRDQPWRAIGLGAAAGILLGLAAGALIAGARRRD
jgi:ElaB/YqjD/DUF883 family membrane-anchored ribosome-binding protein